MKQVGRQTQDFGMTLMLAAVVGAIAQLAGTVVEIGRAAGWWQ